MEVLSEWKDLSEELARFTGAKPIPVKTLKRWSAKYLELNPAKSHPSQQGRILVEKEIAHKWYQYLMELYPNLARRAR